MTGYELPFLVLLAMYLSECIAWVPDTGFAFRARPGRPWRRASDPFCVLGERWRGMSAGWIPGTGGIAVAEAGPPPLSPHGVCACAETGPAEALRYEDLGPLETDGVTVRAGSRVIARAGSPRQARRIRELLERLQTGEPREELIRAEHDRLLDTREARRRTARHRLCARPLAWITRALAAALFVVLPAGLLVGGMRAGAPLLAVALVLTGVAVWRFRALLHRAGGGRPTAERLITMLLMPPAAIRADDFLARDLFGGLHALALARTACDPLAACALAAEALRRLRHPIDPGGSACCEAGAWVALHWRNRLERWIEAEYGPAAALLEPPAPETPSCVSYCPRCMQQYRAGRDQCSDCPGVPLGSVASV